MPRFFSVFVVSAASFLGAPVMADSGAHHAQPTTLPEGHPSSRTRVEVKKSRPAISVGLELGEASGATASAIWQNRHEATALVGYSPIYQGFVLHGDYAYRFYRWMPSERYGVLLTFFGGGGVRVGLFEPRPRFLREPPFSLGGRLPVGISATLPPIPAELVITLAPGGDILPEPRFRTEGAVALRFALDPHTPDSP